MNGIEEDKLFSIRCPFMITTKSGQLVKCNQIAVKVYRGSSGEAKCRHCKGVFDFHVDDYAMSLVGVRVKPVPRKPQS